MRDSEAEAFLIRIEEGRELFLVSFACLPFFLLRFSGIALDVRISRSGISLLRSGDVQRSGFPIRVARRDFMSYTGR